VDLRSKPIRATPGFRPGGRGVSWWVAAEPAAVAGRVAESASLPEFESVFPGLD
jgi:hypothetical protein